MKSVSTSITNWLSKNGYSQRGPTWFSLNNKISWTDYGDVWGLHIVRNGYADYMCFKLTSKKDFKTLLKLIDI